MIQHAVTPQTFQEAQMLALARRKGVKVTPWGSAGSVRLAGPGVDVIFAALRFVEERDFQPAAGR